MAAAAVRRRRHRTGCSGGHPACRRAPRRTARPGRGSGTQSTSRKTRCSAPAPIAVEAPRLRAADSGIRPSRRPVPGRRRSHSGADSRRGDVVRPPGRPSPPRRRRRGRAPGAQPTDLAREVGVPPAHDRDDGQPRGRHADPAEATRSRRPAASASRWRAASWAPCPVLHRDQPSPPRRYAASRTSGQPSADGHSVRPSAIPNRPRAFAVAACSPNGRRCAMTTAGGPCRGDLGDGVLPGVGDHDVGRSTARTRGRVSGCSGLRSVHVQPGVDLRAASTDASSTSRPPAPHSRSTRRCAGSRPGAGGRAPAVEAGQRAHAPRLGPPRLRPVGGVRLQRPGREQGVGEVVGERGARGPSRSPGSATTTTGMPHNRASRATSTETSTTSAAGRSRAIQPASVAIRARRPACRRGAQCSTPCAVTSSRRIGRGRRRAPAAPSRRASRPGAGSELRATTGVLEVGGDGLEPAEVPAALVVHVVADHAATSQAPASCRRRAGSRRPSVHRAVPHGVVAARRRGRA